MSAEKHQFNLPEFEEKILKFWEEKYIFKLTLAKTKKGKPFVFYEGPPTANGSPGIHHVEARAFKDLMSRYKTMRGFFVPRKAGWDTHGLPVEIQVEKELGLKTKQDIEKYGIAPFNIKAKESVWRYKEEWDHLTKRMGFWLDLEHPYITYDPLYMESLWWIIKEFWKKKLLVEDFKVLPWCTRCQTGLSTHELAQGYKLVKDKSVYVKFKLDTGQKIGNFTTDDKTYILAWTTTPWTLPGNVALAISPTIEYVRVKKAIIGHKWDKQGKVIYENIILAKRIYESLYDGDFKNVFRVGMDLGYAHNQPEGYEAVQAPKSTEVNVKDLVGLVYQSLFNVPELKSAHSYKIYPADFVTAEDGTGVVHTAVMYGEDDYKLGKKIGLPTSHTVDETGRFVSSVKELAGMVAKNEETEKKIISLLQENGNLLAVQEYEHDYPYCWRCGTALLYYARKAWWVRTTEVKKELLANNETINWVPEHLKKGRFGEFLKDVRDWAFSRERYWGTPLPIWRCNACNEIEVIGSIEELRKKSAPSRNQYIFMRHGEALSNVRNITSSKGEAHKLTIKGRTQVEMAAKKLKKQKIEMIISSPILRAQETSVIVSKVLDIPVHTDARLAEINVGMLDGRPAKEYDAYFSSWEEKFIKRPPEGENLSDVRSRVLNFIEEMEKKYSGKKILVIGHEYLIWMAYAGGLGLTNEQAIGLRAGKQRNDFVTLAEVMNVQYASVPRDETGEINLHRPFVDEFIFSCTVCGKGNMKRVSEVADVWFDSGAMPFAQAHYPFSTLRHPERSEGFFMQKKRDSSPSAQNDGDGEFAFPADYISEAVDQTRGWFYTLLAIATLLGKRAPYKNVISLGHVLDKNGQKMSKSKGNVVNPFDMIQKYGIDTLRWYFYSINSPGEPKRFDEKDLLLKQRSFLGTWWNSFVLFDTYVGKVKSQKAKGKSAGKKKHVLDRWILEKTNQLVSDVTEKLDTYDITGASRAIEQFAVSDFSQWYLRRSRERFQRPKSKQEKEEAAVTTAYVLGMLCRLTAPFTPFLSEYIYQELRKKTGQKEISVHLLAWPNASVVRRENPIIKDMERVRTIVGEALKLRADAGIKVRQPLQTLCIPDKTLSSELWGVIQDEVNVKEVVTGKELLLDTVLTPELKEEGMVREFTRNIQEMRRDLGLMPIQKARVVISGDSERETMITKWQKKIKQDTNLLELRVGGKKEFRIEREIDIDGKRLWIGMR